MDLNLVLHLLIMEAGLSAWENDLFNMYVNGNLAGELDLIGLNPSFINWRLLTELDSADYQGGIDNILIWNRALTSGRNRSIFRWVAAMTYIEAIVGLIIGALSSGIPLYIKIRKTNLQLQEQAYKISSRQTADQQKLATDDRINHEKEWKRIIEFRDAEMSRLRERDEQQERKILDLYDRHTECQKSEARQSERISFQTKLIDDLVAKVTRLEEILTIRGLNDSTVHTPLKGG